MVVVVSTCRKASPVRAWEARREQVLALYLHLHGSTWPAAQGLLRGVRGCARAPRPGWAAGLVREGVSPRR
ncbi:hypothetical protein GCM10010211_06850 [Streptomyces albospinus]|uniref:Transposase n=1 Tax=Streptomyces albospinus TaxID=285515 RepID=A0ABQ2UQF6_9ACTN|nr:hypothetical protein GCM10010211_06850 [Streptomyces albospinus]